MTPFFTAPIGPICFSALLSGALFIQPAFAGSDPGGVLENQALFGNDVANIGDLDGDGTADMAVGSPGAENMSRGRVWILFLNPDGTVKAKQPISDSRGQLSGPGNPGGLLFDNDNFGTSITRLGDLDGDGIVEIAVGAALTDDGIVDAGAVYILFLNRNGTVKRRQKISETSGGLTGPGDPGGLLQVFGMFGVSLSSLGDLDGDGIGDLVVGSHRHDDIGEDQGAVFILFLNSDGTVKNYQKITDSQGGLSGPGNPGGLLGAFDRFGRSVTNLGDVDGDGVQDIAVGAVHDDNGGEDRGAVYVLFLNTDGTVKTTQKLSDTTGGFSGAGDPGGELNNLDRLGRSVAGIGDLNGDGIKDLAAGTDTRDLAKGTLYIVFLNADGTAKATTKISDMEGGFSGPGNPGGELDTLDRFARSVTRLPDLDGDGVQDLAVGAIRDDDGGAERGAVYILFTSRLGTVLGKQKISDTSGCFSPSSPTLGCPLAGNPGGTLTDTTAFGHSVGTLGDLDGDGTSDIIVGVARDDSGAPNAGAAWILFLNPDGTVKWKKKLSDTDGNFSGPENPGGILQDGDRFGSAVSGINDFDGDGVPDAAIGANRDNTGAPDAGAVYICLLNIDGSVKSRHKISNFDGLLTGPGNPGGLLHEDNLFGGGIEPLGDLDGDGVDDLAVSAHRDDDGADRAGALYILFMRSDAQVKARQKISDLEGGLSGVGNPGGYLDELDRFARSITALGDLDGDGVIDVAAGTQRDDDGATDAGAVYIVFLNTDGTVKALQKLSDTEGGFTGPGNPGGVLDPADRLGRGVATLGDMNLDGYPELAVGAVRDDDGSLQTGAAYIVYLQQDGTALFTRKLSDTWGQLSGADNPGGLLGTYDLFGRSTVGVGDLDGDGLDELAVGAVLDDDGGEDRGAVYILFLNYNGTVRKVQKISDTEGLFSGAPAP